MVPDQILKQYNGQEVNINPREMIFLEGEPARFYWQVIAGSVKMVNYSEDGQEFAQGIFNSGESFGEPPLFTGDPYPGTAVAIAETRLWKLSREAFLQLLREHFELHLAFTSTLCKRLYYKATLMKEISSHSPEHRIITLIDLLKDRSAAGPEPYEVPYTRQQLADMTGLRVETVIRSIKTLEKQGELKIVNRKVYR